MPPTDILTSLTDVQRQAAMHLDGPALVLAGPGSGKTRVITHRVAHLINHGVAPTNILAITFTNKAAQEMRTRLFDLQVARGATLCTFHSLAARLLREFADRAAIPANFVIYDTADQLTAVREAIKAAQITLQNFTPGFALDAISKYKNDLVTPEDAADRADDFHAAAVTKAYLAYQHLLTNNGALDFDDLLMKLALLLRDDPALRQDLNQRYRYLLVDEYQDTNHCQYQIARGLSLDHHNIFLTGDPDQAIYGWRGADIGNILAFERDYPDAPVFRLEENFRSTPQILALADELIQANTQRKEKTLFTSAQPGPVPTLVDTHDEYDEGRALTDWIEDLRRQDLQYRDIAVFYRVNSMSRVLEESLRRRHVPYQIVRGVEFFKRREIKDLLAYLHILANPADQISLKRIINRPTRGIGSTTVTRLINHAAATGTDIWHTLTHASAIASLNAAAQTRIKAFVDLIKPLQSQLTGPVAPIMQNVYEKTGLAAALKADKSEDPANNVEELLNSARRYDTEADAPSLADYLQQIALISDADAYDAEAGAVSLMTLHAAKGLEFPAVRIIGVEDGLIPHARTRSDSYASDDLEEERRLLFVGMTRAMHTLSLSFARFRTTQGAVLATNCSEFLRPLTALQQHRPPAAPSAQTDSFADDYPDDSYYDQDQSSPQFYPGQLVRHPKFGLARILTVTPSRENTRVQIQLNTGARKTIVLKYANLEPLDFPA